MTLKYTDMLKPDDISIAQLWVIFAGATLGPGAPQTQREEMRKSFYAGFVECFALIDDMSSNLPEAESVKALTRLHQEAFKFFESLAQEASSDE